MSSHHNESQPQPQYDGKYSTGFTHLNGQQTINISPVEPKPADLIPPASESATPTAMPVWDRERRELRLGGTVVKRFKWPAENQERVLDAFQELGWPGHIDDPLEQHPRICPKRRLHDTLKCLNRKQISGAIKFRGDGTGRGVLLEIVEKQQ